MHAQEAYFGKVELTRRSWPLLAPSLPKFRTCSRGRGEEHTKACMQKKEKSGGGGGGGGSLKTQTKKYKKKKKKDA